MTADDLFNLMQKMDVKMDGLTERVDSLHEKVDDLQHLTTGCSDALEYLIRDNVTPLHGEADALIEKLQPRTRTKNRVTTG